MFKITCFIELEPLQLRSALKGLHFKQTSEGFIWSLDGNEFRIEPFKQKSTRGDSYGYRVYFDGSIDGGLYLFNLSMGFMNPKINAVEYDVYSSIKQKHDWIRELNSRRDYKKLDVRGIYQKGSVGIVVLEDCVNLQIRPIHKKTLRVMDCLKELQSIHEEFQPNEFDILSFLEGGAAI